MISGSHVIVYSRDADADRALFRDVLRLRSVDAGGGWLIFALPPANGTILECDGPVARLAAAALGKSTAPSPDFPV